MLDGNKIFVPSYQRAYSWDSKSKKNNSAQTNTFLSDLVDYNKSESKTPYYFGHFLFEEKPDRTFGVIDGQQRLTTIVIFLSALFNHLKAKRKLTENEEILYENMIKRRSSYTFSTVDYDNQLFKDYVVDQTKKDTNGLETESAKRIVKAFDFFSENFTNKDEPYLVKMLTTVTEASCTTHPVSNESEAIQMFIFQNNRGKKPSNLEIIKAQFMFAVHLSGGGGKDNLIDEIKSRFEKIYKSISSIEYKISEDDVLTYTLRVYFNSLWEANPVDRINKLLSEENPISFIKSFTNSLAISFDHLTTFFGKDERENIEVHSLITLGGASTVIPFIIKAYTFGLPIKKICEICSSLESIVLRHRLIGTRAELATRINEVYQSFTSKEPSIIPIIDRINFIKNISLDDNYEKHYWWAYWSKPELEKSIQGSIQHSIAKFILWKYEMHLEKQGNNGYLPTRFDSIEKPELEHIAPQTPTKNKRVASGYCKYDEEFKKQYLDCLGNYLLISKSHNCSVGNRSFNEKRNSYEHLYQQREIQDMTKKDKKWTKDNISQRKNKIIDFVLNNL